MIASVNVKIPGKPRGRKALANSRFDVEIHQNNEMIEVTFRCDPITTDSFHQEPRHPMRELCTHSGIELDEWIMRNSAGVYHEFFADNIAIRGLLAALTDPTLDTGSTDFENYRASLVKALDFLWD